MAFPTSVNSQITDAITQANVKVLGDAPAVAMSNLFQAVAQAMGNSAHNAVSAQQQANVLAQAVTTRCVQLLLGPAAAGDGQDNLLNLLNALRAGTAPMAEAPPQA
jgi:hypothetical protein